MQLKPQSHSHHAAQKHIVKERQEKINISKEQEKDSISRTQQKQQN